MVDERSLEAAGTRALARADKLAPDAQAHWVAEEHGWRVPSSRPNEAPHLVTRKHPPTFATREDGTPTLRRSKGYWWFVLTCSCPAEASGYAVCWHKAAVFRWWQRNRRVDGDAYTDLAPHSNRTEQAAADVDADGVERWKDRDQEIADEHDEWEQRRCWDQGWCDGYEDCGRECDCTACDLARRGVPLTSPDADFDNADADIERANLAYNTRRLLDELPW
jgi:hypothetical protein